MMKSLLLVAGLCVLITLVGLGIHIIGQQTRIPTGVIHPLPDAAADPSPGPAPPLTPYAEAPSTRDLADLLRRIESLERAEEVASSTGRRLAAIESRLDQVEQQVRSMRPASPTRTSGSSDADVARQLRQLGLRVSELERVDPAMPTQDTIRSLSRSIDGLRDDLTAVRHRLREIEYDR